MTITDFATYATRRRREEPCCQTPFYFMPPGAGALKCLFYAAHASISIRRLYGLNEAIDHAP